MTNKNKLFSLTVILAFGLAMYILSITRLYLPFIHEPGSNQLVPVNAYMEFKGECIRSDVTDLTLLSLWDSSYLVLQNFLRSIRDVDYIEGYVGENTAALRLISSQLENVGKIDVVCRVLVDEDLYFLVEHEHNNSMYPWLMAFTKSNDGYSFDPNQGLMSSTEELLARVGSFLVSSNDEYKFKYSNSFLMDYLGFSLLEENPAYSRANSLRVPGWFSKEKNIDREAIGEILAEASGALSLDIDGRKKLFLEKDYKILESMLSSSDDTVFIYFSELNDTEIIDYVDLDSMVIVYLKSLKRNIIFPVFLVKKDDSYVIGFLFHDDALVKYLKTLQV